MSEIKAKLVRKIENGGAWYFDKYELECIKCGKHYFNGRYDSRTNPYCNDCKREIEKERNRILKEEKRKRLENSIQKEEIKHWFESEIELAKERMNLEYNPMFNGVEVGHEKQIELNKAHIRFCEYVIMALCKEG